MIVSQRTKFHLILYLICEYSVFSYLQMTVCLPLLCAEIGADFFSPSQSDELSCQLRYHLSSPIVLTLLYSFCLTRPVKTSIKHQHGNRYSRAMLLQHVYLCHYRRGNCKKTPNYQYGCFWCCCCCWRFLLLMHIDTTCAINTIFHFLCVSSLAV